MRVGIDLGTTYSVVAYLNPRTNKPEIIKNRYGNHLTPSVLAFIDNQILYGEEALTYTEEGTADAVSYFKRYIGSEEYGYEGNGEIYTAKELSSILLKCLVRDAEKEIGEKITEAVITVPAYFTHKERKATIEAARAAGIQVLHIINEPTAAMYAYGMTRRNQKEYMLVYDLGGGTFDVAVASIERERIRILGSAGNHELGGKDWDDLLARHLCGLFYEEFGIDLSADRSQVVYVEAMARKVKKRLSAVSSTECVISYGGKTAKYTVSETGFREMSKQLLEITGTITRNLLESVGIEKETLSGVLLVGGATRMPMVHDYVEELVGSIIKKGIHVDEAVALGAAIKAAEEEIVEYLPELLGGEKEARQERERLPGRKRLEETVAHSLGMISISKDGGMYVNSIIIHRNTPIPASNTRAYRLPTVPGKNRMEIYLLQGENGDPLECELAGKYIVNEIHDTPQGEAIIEVTYTYNEEGMIEVRAEQDGEPLMIETEERKQELSWVRAKPAERKSVVRGEEGCVYLAVDLSGSMAGGPLLQAKRAIEEFVQNLDLARMEVAMIGFADQAELLLEPTHEHKKIERALRNMRVDGRRFGYGNTASPFSIVYGRQEQREHKEYIVLVTDGVWAYKENALKEARRCKEMQIEIHALGFGAADEQFLEQIVSREEYADMTELTMLTQGFTKIAQIIGT